MTSSEASNISQVPQSSHQLSHAVEDYLRTILLLEQHSIAPTAQRLREILGTSLATVSGTLKRLEREGLIYRDGKHRVHMTPVGRIAAECVMRRNRLVERFLYDVLEVPFAQLAHQADRMEHAVSPRIERHLFQLLGQPETCPHGNSIRPDVSENTDSRLASYRFGRIEVTRVLEAVVTDTGFMGWLESNAILPGRRFEVVGSSNGRLILAGDGSTIGVPRPAGELIMASFASEMSRSSRAVPLQREKVVPQ